MCREITEWHDTGLLPDGKVRWACDLANAALPPKTGPFYDEVTPRNIESIVSSEAMRHIAATGVRS